MGTSRLPLNRYGVSLLRDSPQTTVRACEETFRTIVFDALGGKRDECVLGEPTRRRPVLPGPAPLRSKDVAG